MRSSPIRYLALVLVCVQFAGCASQEKSTSASSNFSTRFVQLATDLDSSKTALLGAVTTQQGGSGSIDPATETKVNAYADAVESHCALVIQELTSEVNGLTAKQNGWNTFGEFVTVIGGVTVYAPAKAVLMAIGISSSGGGNSVIGSIATNDANKVKVAQSQINDVQTNYQASIAKYNAIVPNQDISGSQRYGFLRQARASCDQLYAVATPAPASQ